MAQSGTRLNSLTGVRFLAALLVFGFHAQERMDGQLSALSAGMVGVSLFYILSGFVMSWTSREGDTTMMFYRRRFARIYPAYIAAWLCYLAVPLMTGGRVGLIDVFVPPTLLQSWVPLREIYFAGNAVFWSLSCEVFFYLLFPALHRLMVTMSSVWVTATAVVAGMVSLGVAALLIPFEGEFARWFVVICPPVRLMEFVIGVALGILFRRGWRLPMNLWLACAMVGTAVWLASVAPYALSRYAVTLVPFVLLVAALASADLGGRASVFARPAIATLGAWSYAFYLIHPLGMTLGYTATARVVGSEGDHGWTGLAFSMALGLVMAWLLHRLIEMPAEARLRPSSQPARLDT